MALGTFEFPEPSRDEAIENLRRTVETWRQGAQARTRVTVDAASLAVVFDALLDEIGGDQ